MLVKYKEDYMDEIQPAVDHAQEAIQSLNAAGENENFSINALMRGETDLEVRQSKLHDYIQARCVQNVENSITD